MKTVYWDNFAHSSGLRPQDGSDSVAPSGDPPCSGSRNEYGLVVQRIALRSGGIVKLARSGACGTVMGMSTTSNPYRGFRFPAEITNQAIWLYHCFSLSLRDVELILAARGVVVSYETIREWSLRFGRTYAKTLGCVSLLAHSRVLRSA